MTGTWTTVPAGYLHAWTVGEPRRGDAVVVPGLAVSAYMRPTAAVLARCGYRAWVLDLLGFGDSGEPAAERRGMADLADEAGQWLSARRIDRPVLVGQSLGTQVVARLAGSGSALVLQGPTVDPRYRTPVRALGRWLLDSTRESPAMGRTQVPEWRRAGPRRMVRTFLAALDDDLDETLSGARPPTLVVRGSRDPLATPEWARGLAPRPGDAYEEMPGTAHCSCWDEPAGFAALVDDFVSSSGSA